MQKRRTHLKVVVPERDLLSAAVQGEDHLEEQGANFGDFDLFGLADEVL